MTYDKSEWISRKKTVISDFNDKIQGRLIMKFS